MKHNNILKKNKLIQIPRLLVIFHLHYHNQVDFFVKKLKNINHCNWDLYVTYSEDNEASKEKILKVKQNANFIKVENGGYDILPFYKIIKKINLDSYDYVLKIHTKAFRQQENKFGKGFLWRNNLVNALLGTKGIFRTCLKILKKQPSIGMIATKNSILDMNTRLLPEDTYLYDEICQKYNLPNRHSFFVAGTMFICRASLLKWLQNLTLDEQEFFIDNEQTGMCGKPIHVLERLLGTMIESQGYEIYGVKTRKSFEQILKIFLQNVFSIKNSNDKKHKIITILGIRTSIKN